MNDRNCPTCQRFRKIEVFRVISKPGEPVKYARKCMPCEEQVRLAAKRRAAA